MLRVLKHVLQADLFPNQMEMSLQKLNGQPEHVCGDSNVSFGMVPFFLGSYENVWEVEPAGSGRATELRGIPQDPRLDRPIRGDWGIGERRRTM